MAVTYGTPTRIKLSPQNWLTITDVTLDSSYATGGESVTANGLGLDTITGIQSISCDDGWQLAFNAGTTKIQAFASIVGLTETVTRAACTDNTDATGYKDFANTVPAGMVIYGSRNACSVAWIGDTSCVWQAGVSGALSRYSADTAGSCFTAITTASLATAATGADGVAAAVTPRITFTSAADFTNVSAGTSAITIFYGSATGGLVECAVGTDMSAVVGKVFALGK